MTDPLQSPEEEMFNPPSWLLKPVAGHPDANLEFELDPDIEATFMRLIPDKKRRRGLIKQAFRYISLSTSMDDRFERVMGLAVEKCNPREKVVWMELFKEFLPHSKSAVGRYRLLKFLENPEVFLFTMED